MREWVLLVAVVAASGCLSPIEALLKGDRLAMSPIETNCGGGGERNVIVTSAAEWREICSMAPLVDFANHSIVASFWGGPTSGYSVSIDSIVLRGGMAEVDVTRTVPGRDCVVLQVFTGSNDVVSVPHADLEGRFFVKEVEHRCNVR